MRILPFSAAVWGTNARMQIAEAIAKPGRDGVPSPSAAGGGTPALPFPRGFAIASAEKDHVQSFSSRDATTTASK